MKVVLFNPRSSAKGKPVLPMSLLAVGAVLSERWSPTIVDGNLEEDPIPVLDGLVAGDAKGTVLAVTVMPGPQLQQAVPVCRELKRRHPDLVVVWGGYFPSQHWHSCVIDGAVDYVIRGHGEMSFKDLLGYLDDGDGAREDIPGLAWCEGGVAESNAMAPVANPSDMPDWDLDSVPMERYLRHTFLGSRTVGLNSSYGCPYRCNFCAVVTLVDGRWLAQPAERVARTVELYNSRWGVDAVEMVDNNFFVHEERVAEFAERILDLGVAWWGEGRVDTMLKFSDRTWQLMRDSGLRMVFLGAESGSAETLERMDKGGSVSPEQTLELVERMRSWGIVPELSFVLGSPPDPEQDAASTMALIRRVKKIQPATEIILYPYTPVPLDGDLLAEAKASGFSFPESLDAWIDPEWLTFAKRESASSSWVRRSLRQRVLDFERVLNAFYPTSTITSLGRWRRALLRSAAAWRYYTGVYAWPIELEILHRLMKYRRPETSGF